MAASNIILIADRNSHVRMFLMREMMAAGYRVKLAATGESVLKIAYTMGAVDLVVLDPDLPGVNESSVLQALKERIPPLPVVLHTQQRHEGEELVADDCFFPVIEKAGNSIERIKEAVGMLLPSRSQDIKGADGSKYREGESS
ncbi:MAG: response regulator [Deltaproteobacteria bacterium]|nr:response regulator [Deltaproteobacteria bacterium]